MATLDLLVAFAAEVRAARAANPTVAGDGTALELLIAPRFQRLLEGLLPALTAQPLQVLPEYRGRALAALTWPSRPRALRPAPSSS